MFAQGSGFGGHEGLILKFIDSATGTTKLVKTTTYGNGEFTIWVTIPADASAGRQHIEAQARASGQSRKRAFTVT